MKRINNHANKRWLFLAALVLIVGAMSFYAARTITSHAKSKSANKNCQSTCVELKADSAMPDAVTIAVKGFVQFNSADGKSHSISLGKGGEEHEHTGPYNSGEFKADEAWRVQFKQAGTFEFHDHYNPKIHATVIVYQPNADYKIQ